MFVVVCHACRLLGVLYLCSQTEAPGLSWLADNVLIIVGCIWAIGALPGEWGGEGIFNKSCVNFGQRCGRSVGFKKKRDSPSLFTWDMRRLGPSLVWGEGHEKTGPKFGVWGLLGA